ncbi:MULTISPECIES: G/U mismatch-specific DNA glycosylase [unclassified Streptomyces]|uniref:G/U mismatch-specific DNA glycosylase n=1 Tax=unclassified Streptomyces TaxID=2593676 RepID=UPI0023EACD5D|nr:G/U mismatch-specific DNA glycosylase [Streptomyces sp. WMMB303]MDF4249189.1 G/U mismatch-specific DNA glycosylase [Streptomyces sp. WMMB303]
MPDVAAEGLRVLFCGINPGLLSAATGHHFARPGNRFWPALHASGFTPRRLLPEEERELLAYGLGITNVVARATARADELTRAEFAEGGRLLEAKAARLRPKWLAVLGVTAYRAAFDDPRAAVGPQERLVGGVPVWLLPNPSGLNAHYTPSALAEKFGELRAASAED